MKKRRSDLRNYQQAGWKKVYNLWPKSPVDAPV
jgi:hypothetical protein